MLAVETRFRGLRGASESFTGLHGWLFYGAAPMKSYTLSPQPKR